MPSPPDSPYAVRPMQDRLLFLVSAPRSGSTLLARILHATRRILGFPEAHLLPPLAHLGPWARVDSAPYDPMQSQQAIRAFLDRLPGGEEAWWQAARAYADVLYGRMFETCGEAHGADCRFLLDKTPANALVLPFLERLYPQARHLFLTRHPAAIFSSYAHTFFDGDYEAAERHNPVLRRYVPAIARALRESPVPRLHLRYEELVRAPEQALHQVGAFLGLALPTEALDYPRVPMPPGLGDPRGVAHHGRPVADGVDRWAAELAAHPRRFEVVARQLAAVPPEDLATWGYPVAGLWAAMEEADPAAWRPAGRRWDRLALERKALVLLRRDIHRRPHGRLLESVRLGCDMLLRGR